MACGHETGLGESEGGRPFPSTTVIVECENVAHAESARVNRMLSELGDQLRSLAGRFESAPEVHLLYDPAEVDGNALQRVTDEFLLTGDGDPISVDLVESPDANYYEQKNRGAERAESEVVVFLDSDVVPESDWLRTLVAPFEDPSTSAVAGHTYLDAETFYGKAFEYFWFFPAREQPRSRGFYANNLAIRRSVFLDYRFPASETFRGQCVELAERLYGDGVGIVQRTGAACSHPPPNGWRHFAVRAVCSGYDRAITRRGPDASTAAGLLRAAGTWLYNLVSAGERIVVRRGHARSRDGPEVLAAAVCLAVAYYLLFFVGQVVTVFSPGTVERRVTI